MLGTEQEVLGREMGTLGERMGEIGERMDEAAEEAKRELRRLLDDAIRRGVAEPVSLPV